MSDYHPYIRIMTDIIDSGLWAELSSAAKTLYPVLLKFSDYNFKPVWPSTETLLRLTGFKTKKSIVQAKKELVLHGLLHQVPGGGRVSTRYHFSFHYPGSKITPLGDKQIPLRGVDSNASVGDKFAKEGATAGTPNHINITISNENHWGKESEKPRSAEEKKEEKRESATSSAGLSELLDLFGAEIFFPVYKEAESLRLEKDLNYLKAACRKEVLLKSKQSDNSPAGLRSHSNSWKGFLDWGSRHLSLSTWQELSRAEVEWNGQSIFIQTPLSGITRQIVSQYFQNLGKEAPSVLFQEKEDASRLMEIR